MVSGRRLRWHCDLMTECYGRVNGYRQIAKEMAASLWTVCTTPTAEDPDA